MYSVPHTYTGEPSRNSIIEFTIGALYSRGCARGVRALPSVGCNGRNGVMEVTGKHSRTAYETCQYVKACVGEG